MKNWIVNENNEKKVKIDVKNQNKKLDDIKVYNLKLFDLLFLRCCRSHCSNLVFVLIWMCETFLLFDDTLCDKWNVILWIGEEIQEKIQTKTENISSWWCFINDVIPYFLCFRDSMAHKTDRRLSWIYS